MCAGLELIALEQNEIAMKLRDKGKLDQARQVLVKNNEYLKMNAATYKSKKLDAYATENAEAADNLDEKKWNKQRKIMRESQFKRATQQSSN